MIKIYYRLLFFIVGIILKLNRYYNFVDTYRYIQYNLVTLMYINLTLLLLLKFYLTDN